MIHQNKCVLVFPTDPALFPTCLIYPTPAQEYPAFPISLTPAGIVEAPHFATVDTIEPPVTPQFSTPSLPRPRPPTKIEATGLGN